MDDLELNDLEYREERKESIQPIKKHIPLKLKSNSNNSIQQQSLLNNKQIFNISPTNDNLVQQQCPSVNKIPRLTYNDIDERLDEDLRFKNLNKKESINKIEKLNWNFKIDLIGTKMNDQNIYCCENCLSPIFIYGRMIPCKHVFCIKCARENQDKCIKNSCRERVERIEEQIYGHIFICTYGKSLINSQFYENQVHSPSKILCGRSYMSARDLQAHIQHRHILPSQQQQQQQQQLITIDDNNQQQFTNNNTNTTNNPSRANLITIMTATPNKNHSHHLINEQQQQQHQHVNLMQINSQLQPALLPTPTINHQFNQIQQQQQQQQQILPSLLDLPPHVKRPFDFNMKPQMSNNIQLQNSFNVPPQNFY